MSPTLSRAVHVHTHPVHTGLNRLFTQIITPLTASSTVLTLRVARVPVSMYVTSSVSRMLNCGGVGNCHGGSWLARTVAEAYLC